MSDDDSSGAPTQAAIKRHLMDKSGSVVSLLTTAETYTDEDFRGISSLLCGRSRQIEAIQAAYQRITTGNSEAFVVRGISGTGKSSLVESMRDIVTENDGGYFVSGKFDQLATRKEPFSAIAAAFSDICDLILQSEDLDDRRKAAIGAALGSDCEVLSRVVSNISKITAIASTATSEAGTCNGGALPICTEDFARFRLACHQFLRVVATGDHPLLIFLDDLQWADEMSLKLIKSLLRDTMSHNTLICIAYRDDEMNGASMLGLGSSEVEQHLPYTEVEVKNLDSVALCSMLMQLLLIEDCASLQALTALLLEKTNGNPNAVVQLLQHLKSKRLLTFSNETFSWDWDMLRIESEVSDNPGDIIGQKINSLDADTQEMLKLAAYMGHSFDIELLQRVLSHEGAPQSTTPGRADIVSKGATEFIDLQRCLRSAVANRLLDASDKGTYRFSHDSNQHYLYNSVQNEEEQQLIHLRIGRSLMSAISENSDHDEALVLLAASNMTRGNPINNIVGDKAEQIIVMQLFLEAATLAASKVSVSDAREYLECALGMMTKGQHDARIKLCIDLQNTYAEVQNCTGFFAESNRAVDTVLQNTSSTKDRTRAQCTKLRSVIYQQQRKEALHWAFKIVLKDLGEKVSIQPSIAQLLVELCRTKAALSKTKPADFLNMPEMENEEKRAAMKVFSILFPVLFMLPNKTLYLYCTLRQIRLSVKYGISPFTSTSLVSYAMALSLLGNVDKAVELGKVSIEMSLREGSCLNARALCLATTSMRIFPWRGPFVNHVDQMLESYQCGLKGGSDFFVAFYGLVGYSEAKLLLGAPLAAFEEEMHQSCLRMKALQAHQILCYQVALWQYILNLLGQSEDPAVLTGEAADEELLLKEVQTSNDTMGVQVIHSCRLRLQISFEDWNAAKKTLPLIIKGFDGFAGSFSSYFCVTDMIMVSLILFAANGKRSYRRLAQKFTKRMRKWETAGVVDVTPLLILIDAEWQFALGKYEEAREMYNKAIVVLKENSFIVHETMAYQRAAHLALRMTDNRDARNCLTASIARHQEWGCTAKVDWLQLAFASTLQSVRPTYEVNITNPPPTDEELRLMSMH